MCKQGWIICTLRACRQSAYRGAIPDVAMPIARVRHARIVASGMDGDGHSSVGICGLYLLFGVGGRGRVMVVDHLRQRR